jgi:hypothetical protein
MDALPTSSPADRLPGYDADDRLDKVAQHPALGGPELAFFQAQLPSRNVSERSSDRIVKRIVGVLNWGAPGSGRRQNRGVNSGTSGHPTPRDRGRWFEGYVERLENSSVTSGGDDGPFACPCCGYLTLGERGAFEICSVCFWEDDGQDEHDADVVRGGPNGRLSLSDARRNFDLVGACEERHTAHVRAPETNEVPADGSGRVLPEVARTRRRRRRFPM